MNILKLIKAQHKQTAKAIALKETLAVNTIEQLDSCQAMARVMHTSAFLRWDKQQERAAVKAFKKAVKETGFSFGILSEEKRLHVLRVAANEVERSPMALKARLKALGQYPSRKDTGLNDIPKA